MTEEKKPLSRSEREAKIKDKAGWVITVLAALLAVNTYIANGFSSKALEKKHCVRTIQNMLSY
jgi:hypothetical protein